MDPLTDFSLIGAPSQLPGSLWVHLVRLFVTYTTGNAREISTLVMKLLLLCGILTCTVYVAARCRNYFTSRSTRERKGSSTHFLGLPLPRRGGPIELLPTHSDSISLGSDQSSITRSLLAKSSVPRNSVDSLPIAPPPSSVHTHSKHARSPSSGSNFPRISPVAVSATSNPATPSKNLDSLALDQQEGVPLLPSLMPTQSPEVGTCSAVHKTPAIIADVIRKSDAPTIATHSYRAASISSENATAQGPLSVSVLSSPSEIDTQVRPATDDESVKGMSSDPSFSATVWEYQDASAAAKASKPPLIGASSVQEDPSLSESPAGASDLTYEDRPSAEAAVELLDEAPLYGIPIPSHVAAASPIKGSSLTLVSALEHSQPDAEVDRISSCSANVDVDESLGDEDKLTEENVSFINDDSYTEERELLSPVAIEAVSLPDEDISLITDCEPLRAGFEIKDTSLRSSSCLQSPPIVSDASGRLGQPICSDDSQEVVIEHGTLASADQELSLEHFSSSVETPLMDLDEPEFDDPDLIPLPDSPSSGEPPLIGASLSDSSSDSDETLLSDDVDNDDGIPSSISKPGWSVRASHAPPLGIPVSSSEISSYDDATSSLALPGSFPSPSLPDIKDLSQVGPQHDYTQISIVQAARKSRSPIDMALAIQLRPGLGIGADAAWMMRFLMSAFGWLAVLVARTTDY